jgi:dimethylargininase
MPTENYAIIRQISRSITNCELTHLQREPIDLERARRQHQDYAGCLQQAGYTLIELAEQPDWPDAVFVEDAAVVLDELAVITRPGALSRRLEVPSVAQALLPFRELHTISAPATLDGGDVLCMDKTIFVGLSSRTNAAGVQQLADFVKPFGYVVQPVPVHECLHLKSAVSRVADNAVLLNPEWITGSHFSSFRIFNVDPTEPHAANALWIQDRLIYPSAFVKTAARLSPLGSQLTLIDVSELAKAEGAVTCCSILFRR